MVGFLQITGAFKAESQLLSHLWTAPTQSKFHSPV